MCETTEAAAAAEQGKASVRESNREVCEQRPNGEKKCPNFSFQFIFNE